jgi:hypothetical protein
MLVADTTFFLVLAAIFEYYVHSFGVLPSSLSPDYYIAAYSPEPTAVCRPILLSLQQHAHLSRHSRQGESKPSSKRVRLEGDVER